MKSSIPTSQCCTLCYSIQSHATLILYYHASMWTLQQLCNITCTLVATCVILIKEFRVYNKVFKDLSHELWQGHDTTPILYARKLTKQYSTMFAWRWPWHKGFLWQGTLSKLLLGLTRLVVVVIIVLSTTTTLLSFQNVQVCWKSKKPSLYNGQRSWCHPMLVRYHLFFTIHASIMRTSHLLLIGYEHFKNLILDIIWVYIPCKDLHIPR